MLLPQEGTQILKPIACTNLDVHAPIWALIPAALKSGMGSAAENKWGPAWDAPVYKDLRFLPLSHFLLQPQNLSRRAGLIWVLQARKWNESGEKLNQLSETCSPDLDAQLSTPPSPSCYLLLSVVN